MNRDFLLKLYDRLTGLVEKLPGGLQKPILRELVPIRELFLEQRPARLLLLGHPSPEILTLLESLLQANLAAQTRPASSKKSSEDSPSVDELSPALPPELPLAGAEWEAGAAESGWRTYRRHRFGSVQVFDARDALLEPGTLQAALLTHRPDVCLVFHQPETPSSKEELARALHFLTQAGTLLPDAPIVGLALGRPDKAGAETGVESLRPALHGRAELAGQPIRVLPLFQPDATSSEVAAAEAICAFLPNSSRLEFALLVRVRSAQIEIARALIKSFTAVCGVIGMQPIPLADLPVLTTLQSLMVALIAQVSGRPLGPRVLTEFFGAVGLSIGVGMLFREGARALIKIIPIWGHAVSGLVAGAGTYAIGRAAIAYFIEESPAREARRLFETLRPKRGSFRKKLT